MHGIGAWVVHGMGAWVVYGNDGGACDFGVGIQKLSISTSKSIASFKFPVFILMSMIWLVPLRGF